MKWLFHSNSVIRAIQLNRRGAQISGIKLISTSDPAPAATLLNRRAGSAATGRGGAAASLKSSIRVCNSGGKHVR